MKSTSSLSLALFQSLRNQHGSVFFSGQGLASILALLSLAAAGDTRRELEEFFKDLGAQPLKALLKLRRDLRQRQGEVKLESATRIWLTSDAKPQFDWPEKVIEKGRFDAAQPSKSAAAINKWASRATRGLIRQVIQPDEISSDISVILTDALSFQGSWQHPFDPDATHRQPFWVGEEAFDVPMMRAFKNYEADPAAPIRVFRGDDWDCLELPYKSSAWRALFIKPELIEQSPMEESGYFPITGRANPPKLKVSLDDLEARLSRVEVFQDLVGGLEPISRHSVIHIPSFSVDIEQKLQDALKDGGVQRIFSQRDSELTALTGVDPTWIDVVRQRVVFKVDELGTKAAATTIAFPRSAPPKVHVYRADHPFLIILYETQTTEILFIGRFAPDRESAKLYKFGRDPS